MIGHHDKELTALLVIEPYNDFISEGGKAWDRPIASRCTRSAKRPQAGSQE